MVFMETPIRSSHPSCKHTDCFDLTDLIQHNNSQNFSKNNLECPICKRCFMLEDIVLDKEYLKIL